MPSQRYRTQEVAGSSPASSSMGMRRFATTFGLLTLVALAAGATFAFAGSGIGNGLWRPLDEAHEYALTTVINAG